MLLLAPFAPHLSEELWSLLGHSESVFVQSWPTFDESYLITDQITIVIQVNGKVRSKLEVPADIAEDELKERMKIYLDICLPLNAMYCFCYFIYYIRVVRDKNHQNLPSFNNVIDYHYISAQRQGYITYPLDII